MNWGLELSPKTDGFMAPARSSPSVDFVCQWVRKSQKEREQEETERTKTGEGGGGAKIKVLHSNLWEAFCNTAGMPRVYYRSVLSELCRTTGSAAGINAQSFDKGAVRRGKDLNKGTKVLLGLSLFPLSLLLYFGAM